MALVHQVHLTANNTPVNGPARGGPDAVGSRQGTRSGVRVPRLVLEDGPTV